MNFNVHFSRKRALVMIFIALAYTAYLFLTGAETLEVKLILPAGLLFFSLPRLHKKHLEFNNGKLTVHAQFGPQKRMHPYEAFTDFEMERGKLFLNRNGQRAPITEQWVVNSWEWEMLEELIRPKPSLSEEFKDEQELED